MRIPGVFATSFEPDGEPLGTAVLVPGRGYPPMAPLLFFAGFTLVEHGWRVEHHWWDPPAYESDEQTITWVRSEVAGALPTSGRVMVVGKSLGTWATPLAAERELPAIWLTPILDDPALVRPIAANPAPQLQMIKQLLTANAVERDLHAVQKLESELLRECWKTPEHAEAVAAFTEKRPPTFPPRSTA